VATVTDSVENRYNSGFFNDQSAVLLVVNRQTGANIIETVDQIKAQCRPCSHCCRPTCN
jgi:Cation/multidrug efflux pump